MSFSFFKTGYLSAKDLYQQANDVVAFHFEDLTYRMIGQAFSHFVGIEDLQKFIDPNYLLTRSPSPTAPSRCLLIRWLRAIQTFQHTIK